MGRVKQSERRMNDNYITPMWCVNGLAAEIRNLMKTKKIGMVVDLGAGDGRIGRAIALPKYGYEPILTMIDIDPRWGELTRNENGVEKDLSDGFNVVDYAEASILGGGVLVVSNPPFALSERWVMHTVRGFKEAWESGKFFDSCFYAIFLLRLDWLATRRRSSFVEDHPPSRIDILVPRPSFTDGGTDAREYGWFWWVYPRSTRLTDIRVMIKNRMTHSPGNEP